MSESPFKDCINKISGPAPVDPSNLCKQASADNKNLFQLISGPINIGNSFKCFCKVGKTGSPVEVLPINCSPVKTPFDSQTAVDDFGSNAQLSLPSLFSFIDHLFVVAHEPFEVAEFRFQQRFQPCSTPASAHSTLYTWTAHQLIEWSCIHGWDHELCV